MEAKSSDRWPEVRRLLEACLELAAEERSRFLETACADPSVRREVAELLARDEHTDHSDHADLSLRDQDPRALARMRVAVVSGGRSEVGPWRLVDVLGIGGSSSVFRAVHVDRPDGIRIALKLLGRDAATPEARRRFRRERDTLASLDHPSIPRLIDSGVTDDGLPWLALEEVDGKPIDVFCEERRLGVRERLDLFARACDAVAHAHAQGLAHRDLKPANLLVDASGGPRLLDFGLAKVPSAAGTRAVAMTPTYASPEQLRGEPHGVPSDVYSLGVLLHELLTGELPNRSRPLQEGEGELDLAGDLAAAARTTSAQRPRPPSTFAHGPDLRRELEGPVDAILLCALAEDPRRRPADAAAFAREIRRHLRGEPVSVKPPGTLAHVQWWMRRHRRPLRRAALAMTIVVALVAAAGSLRSQLRMTEASLLDAREQARATGDGAALLAITLHDLLGATNAARANLPAVAWLWEMAPSIEERLAEDPASAADALLGIARTMTRSRMPHLAFKLEARAIDRLRLRGDEAVATPRLVDALVAHARTAANMEHADARALATEALAAARAIERPAARRVAEALHSLALADLEERQTERAKDALDEAFELLDPETGETGIVCARVLRARAKVARIEGDDEDALKLLREARAVAVEHAGASDALTLLCGVDEARLLGTIDRVSEGRELLEQALRRARSDGNVASQPLLLNELAALSPCEDPARERYAQRALAIEASLLAGGRTDRLVDLSAPIGAIADGPGASGRPAVVRLARAMSSGGGPPFPWLDAAATLELLAKAMSGACASEDDLAAARAVLASALDLLAAARGPDDRRTRAVELELARIDSLIAARR